MKTVILLPIFSLLALFTYAQQDSVEQYCEIVATQKFMSTRVTIEVDYGQVMTAWRNTRKVRDEEGKMVAFNSVIDAVNFMGKNDWKLVNAFPISEPSGPKVYHYVFKKNFPKSETISEGVTSVYTVPVNKAAAENAAPSILGNISYNQKKYAELTDVKEKKAVEKLASKLKPIAKEIIQYPSAEIELGKSGEVSFSGFPEELTEKLHKAVMAE